MDWQDLTAAEREALKVMAFETLLGFTRVFFRLLEGQKFIVNWHHRLWCAELEDVYYQRQNRLLGNTPPGSTKTELVSIHFPAWAIYRALMLGKTGLNTRHLGTSYSNNLVVRNGSRIQRIVTSTPFQHWTGAALDASMQAKDEWMLNGSHTHHVYYGSPLFGQIMGARAGYMGQNGYTGAMLIDDPMPTKDESSFVKTDATNKAMNRILRSRLATNDTPIVMIQQRIVNGDTTDFLTSDKAPDTYHHVIVPAVVSRAYVDGLPGALHDVAVKDTGIGPGPKDRASYWPSKEPLEAFEKMEKADPFLFHAQYQQAPNDTFLEGVIYAEEIRQMLAENRAGPDIPIEKHLLTNTWWDLGINDMMTIWITQQKGFDVRFIGFYQNHDTGIEHYIEWLMRYQERFGVIWGTHYGPHDTKNRNKMTGKTDQQVAKEMGIDFKIVPRPVVKRETIQATRKAFPRYWINTDLCGMDPLEPLEKQANRWGWAGIQKYHRIYDSENEVFLNEPAHDWASHIADSFGLVGVCYEEPKAIKTPLPVRSTRPGSWQGA